MNSFYNPYMIQGSYINDLQNMRDNIDKKIQQIQQQNYQQPTNLTQNFQLAPTNGNNNIKNVNSLDEVQKELVLADTYFFNNDMTNLWIKNSKGDIRTFDVKEIVPKDEKDILIENLQKQIEELKENKANEYNKPNGEQLYEQSNAEYKEQFREQITKTEPSNVSNLSNNKTTKHKS